MSSIQLSALFFVQIAVILVVCRLVGLVGRLFAQPQVVGEMVAGLVLGPSLLGALSPHVQQWLFPPESRPLIYAVAQVGLVLYMFLMGVGFHIDLALARARAAAAVSLAGILVPFALGALLAWRLYGDGELFVGGVTLPQAALFMGASMSITAFPMLARIIEERGLTGTSLGALALAAASLDDVLAWCALAMVLASAGTGGASTWIVGARAIGGGLVYLVVVYAIVRPLMRAIAKGSDASAASPGQQANDIWPISPEKLSVMLILLCIAAWCTDAIGIHAVFGAFFLGLAVPRGQFAQRLQRMMTPVTTGLLLPTFFVYSGLNTHIGLIDSWRLAGVAAVVLAAACVGKFGACALAARFSGSSPRESLALGSLMNARGMTGLIILNIGLDRGILTATMFTIGVAMAIATTLLATPLFLLISRRGTTNDPGFRTAPHHP